MVLKLQKELIISYYKAKTQTKCKKLINRSIGRQYGTVASAIGCEVGVS